MGVGRSLYQTSRDGLLPRWFGKANKHSSPGNAMVFNVVCSLLVLLFGSPVRIYIFSNLGYLLALLLAMVGYFIYAQFRPELARPVRMPGALRWVALAIGLFWLFTWAYGGWNSPALVVGEKSHVLFLIGLAVVAAYLPLYGWRRLTDRWRSPAATVIAPLEPASASASAGVAADAMEA
jgi:amino acid transporter